MRTGVVCMTFFLLVSLCLSLLVTATAQSQKAIVGVNVGNWAKYGDILVKWGSTDQSAKPSQEFIELNNTEWVYHNVSKVSSTKIIFRQVIKFKDGTQNTSTLQVDVNTGTGNGTLMFIPANKSLGDPLYPFAGEATPLWINETILRTYVGVTREVNHLEIIQSRPLEGGTTDISINYYWDRETGILTERSAELINKTGKYITSYSRSDKIVETNLWSAGEDQVTAPNYGFWPVGMVIAIVVIIVTWRLWPKKKRKRRTRKLHARFTGFIKERRQSTFIIILR